MYFTKLPCNVHALVVIYAIILSAEPGFDVFNGCEPFSGQKSRFSEIFGGFRTKTCIWEPGSEKTDKISARRSSDTKIRTKTSQNSKNRCGQKPSEKVNFVPDINRHFQGSWCSLLPCTRKQTLNSSCERREVSSLIVPRSNCLNSFPIAFCMDDRRTDERSVC